MNEPPEDDLLDTGQIAILLSVTRKFVTDKLTKRRGFPPPVTNLTQRLRRWRRADVIAYLAQPAPVNVIQQTHDNEPKTKEGSY